MAVVITSKFHQEAEWKDISKVVFTSPNMISPAIAGTRSHILPGEGYLGMWYEDTSEMFRIEDVQATTDSDFYNFRMHAKEEIHLHENPTFIEVVNTNYDNLDKYVRENSGVEIVGYEDTTYAVDEYKVKLEYTIVQSNLNELFTDSSDTIVEVLEERTMECSSTTIGGDD